MQRIRLLVVIHFLIALRLEVSSSCFAQTRDVESTQATDFSVGAVSAKPSFPLIVRIDKSALESLIARKVDSKGAVKRTVMETEVTGESHTQGGIAVSLVPVKDNAHFDLHFIGHTHTNTTGLNGPAVIHSHTETDFSCSKPITFHPRLGFVSGTTTIKSNTQLTFDGFDATIGLGRRVVTRIARERANESHEAARQIAARDNDAEVLAGFNKTVNEQLVTANKKMKVAQYIKPFLKGDAEIKTAARSTKDCIYLGLSRDEEAKKLTELPADRAKIAPIEIWVHHSVFGDRVANLLTIVEQRQILTSMTRSQIIQALTLPDKEEEKTIEVAVHEGWFVIGIKNEVSQIKNVSQPQPVSKSNAALLPKSANQVK